MAYEKPVVTPIGNLNDLLHRVCVGVDQARGADGWVWQLVVAGWAIAVAPIAGHQAPYQVTVSAPSGVDRFFRSSTWTVEEAVRHAVTFLEAEKVAVNRIELERLGRGIDRS